MAEARGLSDSPSSESDMLRMLRMPGARYEDLLTVPARHAVVRLNAASVSLLRWQRDRALLRCVVSVGAPVPGGPCFLRGDVFDLAEYADLLDAAASRAVGYVGDHAGQTPVERALQARRSHHAAVSVPVQLDARVWGVLWATTNGRALRDNALAVAARVAETIAPMIALAERLKLMDRLACEDQLTELGNRRRLDDALVDLLSADGPGCTVVICDIDGLKQINNEHGHDRGDRVIVAVADALGEAIRSLPGGVAARLGGDEFALLIPGSARSPAIQAVEEAAARLRPEGISLSCGVAAMPAGTEPRAALAVADAAQYGAKRRGVLLLVAADLEPAPTVVPRRRVGDSLPASCAPLELDVCSAVAIAVRTISDRLLEAPSGARGRLEWLGEQLLAPFELDHWTVSVVDLDDPAPRLVVGAMGIRVGRPIDDTATDLMTDHVFDVAAYPLTERAVREGGWFCIDVHDESADPAERALLGAIGMQYLLAVGHAEGAQGQLLELYGHADNLDLRLLGSTLGLAASALLGARISQVIDPRAKMGA